MINYVVLNAYEPSMTQKHKLAYLDSLRGIASLIVVISHLSLIYFPFLHNFDSTPISDEFATQRWIHNSPFGFFYSGTSAVFVFFVMSGIVLSLSASSKNIPLYKNIAARYIRLGIPAAMSCLVAYFAYVLVNHYHLVQSDNYINDAFEIKNAGFLNALYYGLVRSIFYLRGSMEYNPVLWTMAIEFYGSLALFIAYKQKHPLRVMFVIAILFMAINTTVFLGIFSFYIGMLIKEKFSEYKNNAVSLLLIILGLYFAGIHTSSLSYSYIANLAGKHSYDIFNFISGVLIVLGVMSNTTIQRFLSHSFLVWFGSLSFPLYLIHWATIYVFSNLFYLYGFENSLINSVAIIVISILIASIFIKVDTISIKLSKKIKQ